MTRAWGVGIHRWRTPKSQLVDVGDFACLRTPTIECSELRPGANAMVAPTQPLLASADSLCMHTCPLEIALFIVALHAATRRDPVDLGELAARLLREHRPFAQA